MNKYPELVDAFEEEKLLSFVVDGKIFTLEHGLSNFALFQQSMQVQHPGQDLQKKIPVLFYPFDLLFADSYGADYSFRSATIGSTPAARRAGITDASTAAIASNNVANTSMTGSQGFTPNS